MNPQSTPHIRRGMAADGVGFAPVFLNRIDKPVVDAAALPALGGDAVQRDPVDRHPHGGPGDAAHDAGRFQQERLCPRFTGRGRRANPRRSASTHDDVEFFAWLGKIMAVFRSKIHMLSPQLCAIPSLRRRSNRSQNAAGR